MKENEIDFYKNISLDKDFFINVILQENRNSNKLDMSVFKLNKVPTVNLQNDVSFENNNLNFDFQNKIKENNDQRLKKTIIMDSTVELLKLKNKNMDQSKIVEQYVNDTLQSKFYRFKKSSENEKQILMDKVKDKSIKKIKINNEKSIVKFDENGKEKIKMVNFKLKKSIPDSNSQLLSELVKKEQILKNSFKRFKIDRYEELLNDNGNNKTNIYEKRKIMKGKLKSINYNTKDDSYNNNSNLNININNNLYSSLILDNEIKFNNTILSDRLNGSPDNSLLQKDILNIINDVNKYSFKGKKEINQQHNDESTFCIDNNKENEKNNAEFDIVKYLKYQNLLNTEKLNNFSALDNYLKKHCCNRKHINYDKFFPILENETNLKFPFIKNIGDLSRNMKFKTKLIYKDHDIDLNSMRQVNCNINKLSKEELINRIIKKNVKIIDIPIITNNKNSNFSNYDKIPVTEILNVSDNLIKSFDNIHDKFKRNFDERNRSIIEIMNKKKKLDPSFSS